MKYTPELYLDRSVPILQGIPDPLTFYRSHVAPNKPVLIQGALGHWSALKKWDHTYLRQKMGDAQLTVAVTSNGYADAITDGRFVDFSIACKCLFFSNTFYFARFLTAPHNTTWLA